MDEGRQVLGSQDSWFGMDAYGNDEEGRVPGKPYMEAEMT